MTPLKLAALDEDDLKILSAHVQDAVLKPSEIVWLPSEKRVALPVNRLAWEVSVASGREPMQRRRAVLSFSRVNAVRSSGIDRTDREAVLALLAIRFVPGEPPAGLIELVFAGDGLLRLDAECIEAQLGDLGSAWETRNRPRHGTG